jgi:transcriptional regulator with XRE-family HTH domain
MLRPDWMTLGPRLKQARQAKGLSVFEVAHSTGIRDVSIYAYERGVTEPQATALLALCTLYGLDPRQLVVAA